MNEQKEKEFDEALKELRIRKGGNAFSKLTDEELIALMGVPDTPPYQDSVTMGTAGKGAALKAYIDFTDTKDNGLTKQRIDGLLKMKAYLEEHGIVMG